MKKLYIALLFGAIMSTSSCKKFLDVNTNPNAPQTVEANLYLSPMLHWMATAPQFDGIYIARYTQNWASTASQDLWERHGHNQGGTAPDQGGQIWRTTYYDFGQNLVDMTQKAESQQRWDLLGVAQILKAWGWNTATDANGEIIVKEAIDASKLTFNYDSQEYAYQETLRLIDAAIANLNRTDGAVNEAYLAKTDIIYRGKRALWIKFAYGFKAMVLNHYSNKPSQYKADQVIAAVDASFASNAEDALIQYAGTANDDANFLSATRNNIGTLRQSKFILSLMDGTVFTGAVDPRLSRMLAPSPDGLYRGLEPTFGTAALTTTQQPLNLWGYASQAAANASATTPARYLFARKNKFPIITYAQLQFIKAEAAYKKGDKATALAAYKNAVSAHFDFVNLRNTDDGQSPTQISATEKATYLASASVTPTDPNTLTLSQIMCQKYIAQWAWGHLEQWTDLRRYHYTDKDPITGNQVFIGFAIPTSLFPDNQNKVVQRMRPRFNSEYVWNRAGLDAIGGLATDYQTKEMWITTPQ
ncbi:SusD/RagB family nutrient-binding outer membrane lipoprotein [Pedobacter yonginense]|uniref:SusD/RagB family nutrient-binding outer membrane lipoprotein n=1 Tax=Pedobacter yonginense TaxID=651869 RepID=A0A317EP81_9SPHI|nr:SusD/RagB family nutrient-binding outer membrane lipoprotein [Pedobacter yonginense]PWS27779.1 SusD/RagB family nutrient-binding outer membrane lipoprotein [Pedobacter yonginense]